MPSNPSTTPETTGVNSIQELDGLYSSGEYERVVALSAALIEQTPDLYPLYLLRGASFKKLGEPEKAIACFRKVLELEPGENTALVMVARCLQAAGRIDEAIPYFAENFYLYPGTDSGTLLALAAVEAQSVDIELVDMVLRGGYPKFFNRHSNLEVIESPCTPIVSWCEKHKHRIFEDEAAGEIALVDADGAPVAPYWTEATRFVVVPHAAVMSGWDFVMAPTGEVLDSRPSDAGAPGVLGGAGGFVPSVENRARTRVFHPWTKDVVDIDEDVLFLGASQHHHFGHWIYDFLPKLRAWRRPGGASLRIFTLANLPQAQRETLALFGVQPKDLIEGEIGKVYRFKSLTVGLIPTLYKPVPSTVQFLYQALAPQKTPAIAGAGYFLERSQTARGRAIANPEELAAVLSEFHIRTLRRPELSVAEQNALFSEAGVIVCPFGTDLVTKFQVRPGTDFVVLQFKNLESVYEGIAEYIVRYCAILGLRLHLIDCRLTERAGKLKYHGDMIVDCAALRETLAKIETRRHSIRSDGA